MQTHAGDPAGNRIGSGASAFGLCEKQLGTGGFEKRQIHLSHAPVSGVGSTWGLFDLRNETGAGEGNKIGNHGIECRTSRQTRSISMSDAS